MRHILKIKEQYLERLFAGHKKCEVRYNDRDYQVGDTISFKDNGGAMHIFKKKDRDGNDIACITEGSISLPPVLPVFKITHVLHFPDGLKEGYVVLSIEPVTDADSSE